MPGKARTDGGPVGPMTLTIAVAILAVLIFCALRSDPFAAADRRRGDAAGGAPAGPQRVAAPAGKAARGPGGAAGAMLSLDGGRWADAAVAALSGHVAADVAGASAWRIAGSLAGDRGRDGRIAISTDWSIGGGGGGDGDEARCGAVAVRATSESELYAALDAAFAVAVRASARRGRATCG